MTVSSAGRTSVGFGGLRVNPKGQSVKIEWDVPIRMDDGLELRADVFLPDEPSSAPGGYPAILTYGPYARGSPSRTVTDGVGDHGAREPDVLAGSSNKYQNWEVVDPEKWVPDGYAVVRVDSRGAGRSPGYLCTTTARDARHLSLHRVGGGPAWCSGKMA